MASASLPFWLIRPSFARSHCSNVCEQPAFLLADEPALLGAAAADVLLDGVDLGDALERLARNRRGTRRCEFVEVAPHMRPAERKLDVATLCQLGITGIAVDLQDPLEACEMSDRPLGFAVRCINVDDARWIGAAPWPVIGGIWPRAGRSWCARGRDQAPASSSRRRT